MLLNQWRCLREVAVLLVVALPLRADETLLAHWSFDRLETDGKPGRPARTRPRW